MANKLYEVLHIFFLKVLYSLFEEYNFVSWFAKCDISNLM